MGKLPNFESGQTQEQINKSTTFTKVMGIVHAGVHTLTSLGGMRVTSITSNENAFVDGELGCDSLTNYIRRLSGTSL